MLNLDGPRLKVARAKSEIERLRLAEDAFRQNTKYHIVHTECDLQTRNNIYRVRVEGLPPSPEWGIYIGEIAHNLRSALDQLVYQLALLKTKTPASNSQFPIFLVGRAKRRKPGKRRELIPHFEGMRLSDGRSMIRDLSRKHQAMIERLQPYHRSNRAMNGPHSANQSGARNSHLWWLHEINNADKHRLIQVVGAKKGAYWYSHWGHIEPKIIFYGNMLQDSAKFCSAPSDVHMNPTVFPLISFDNTCPAVLGYGVHYVLSEIAKTVSSIIEEFEKLP